jgi:hypothetical protein
MAPGRHPGADVAAILDHAVIDRYVFVRLREGIDRQEVIARFRTQFDGQPDVVGTNAGIPADDSARSWDLGFIIRCMDLDGVAKVLSKSQDFWAWLDARALVVKTWSFQTA